LTALSIVLVHQALNFRRKDGSVGNHSEVKGLLNGLTNGMVDLAGDGETEDRVIAHVGHVDPSDSQSPMIAKDETGDRVIDDYFGVCPHCGKNDGFINVGRSHWFFCKEHRVKWCAGANLFSSWRHETEAEQRRIYNEIGLGEFEELGGVAERAESIISSRCPICGAPDVGAPSNCDVMPLLRDDK
jgi:hypothetical protein